MSKIVDLIEAKQRGRMPIYPSPLVKAEAGFEPSTFFVKGARVYRVGIQACATVVVEEPALPGEFDERVKCAKLMIQDEIFGEFRVLLRDMDIALMENDVRKATEALRKLRAQMFSA